MMMTRITWTRTLCAVFTFAPLTARADLPNASFEEAADKGPARWQSRVWQGKGEFHHAKSGRTGKRSVMIASKDGGDLTWSTVITVRPRATYRLSGWIKTQDVTPSTGQGALLNVHEIRGARTPAVTGTSNWTRVEVVFDTDQHDSVMVNCLFGGWGVATGRAWYDDLLLEVISVKDFKPAIVIDATKTREPINPYIYGQFIEHLGRCIYGGIWAEMLEDRKFFYPVGAKESPWKVAEQKNAKLTMDTSNPYVGQHTPVYEGAGPESSLTLAQDGLGAIGGRELVGYIVLAREGDARCSASFEAGESGRALPIPIDGSGYRKVPIGFRPANSGDNCSLRITCSGKGTIRIGTVSLMPADNVKGMRADTLALLKQLDAPIYRWPGGNFVSGYNWKDGVGPRDQRPPRKNPAWKGIEHNDFGLDEFMVFCREIKTEPLIVVNSGLGDVAMAVEELQYANGAPETPMGALRARNGHLEPYKVTWWGIGNEMYGDWQLGHMPLEKYVEKHNAFVDAMRNQDPSIKVIAVGATGKWSETMMAKCAGHMDLVSEHFYCNEKPGVLSHVGQLAENIRHKGDTHRNYRKTIAALKGKDIRIAMDEWNYWYGAEIYGQIGPRYFLKDALGVAAALNEFTRYTDIITMANYAQTVNVIGCIKTTKTAASFDTTGLPLMLYRRHYGVIPVEVAGDTMPLDVAAAWTADRKALTVAVVNPMRDEMTLQMSVKGASLTGQGRTWVITGPDPMTYNEPGKPPRVTIVEQACSGVVQGIKVAPISATLFSLAVQ